MFTTDTGIRMPSADTIRDIRIRENILTIRIVGISADGIRGYHVLLPRRQCTEFSTNFMLSLTINTIINIIVKLIRIINITIKFICINNSIAKMSDSSLSPPPPLEPSLPTLQPLLSPTLQLRRTAKKPRLASTDSDLFTSSLFSYTLLETTPPTVQLHCLQPGCLYAPKPQLLSFNQTGNY